MKTFVSTTALMLTVVGLLGGTTFADHETGLADLAHNLQWQSNRVNRTLNYHFTSGPLAREMADDARDITVLTEQIDELIDNNGCMKTVAAKAKELCQVVCELKDHSAQIRPASNSRFSSGQSGCRSGSRYGSFGPTESDVRYLTGLLITMENTLDVMEQELVALNSVPTLPPAPAYNAVPVQPSRFNTRPAPNYGVPNVVAPVNYRNRGGWSVGFRFGN